MKIVNRVKTLYWFWRMTRDWVDDTWIVQRGQHPWGTKWLEMWNPKEYYFINKDFVEKNPELK